MSLFATCVPTMADELADNLNWPLLLDSVTFHGQKVHYCTPV